ncbi:MAG: Asp-tRNA(Asn)/Glu-tRNA(Gln) amidotransferase subunit GatB, partial [Spirochaetaceae bacterium]|nr:Asp-tRNA(Asn)/Glu-tRNA(Gln) amidotransferase subunit GatB [Spirochaetaceae bacterium]
RGISKKVRIHECHLEEDAGKMIHTGNASLLDYNRAGMALLEIVTEPDMASGEEAELFIQQLRRAVRYLAVSDGNMEEGSLRADANISINLPGKGLGRKVEIKNLNSSRFVRLGLNYEAQRQAVVLDGGGVVVQETRLWNENRDQTEPMRTKENAHDYRYFPEPDLPAFRPDADFLKTVDNMQVELPLARQKRFASQYGLGEEAAQSICEERAFADYFEQALLLAEKAGLERKAAAAEIANRMLTDLRRLLSLMSCAACAIDRFSLTPAFFAELICLVAKGTLSRKNAKQVLEIAAQEGRSPAAIMQEKGWEQISDAKTIAGFVKIVQEKEAKTFSEAKAAREAGNDKRFAQLSTYLTGKVIAESRGKADPSVAAAHIAELL